MTHEELLKERHRKVAREYYYRKIAKTGARARPRKAYPALPPAIGRWGGKRWNKTVEDVEKGLHGVNL